MRMFRLSAVASLLFASAGRPVLAAGGPVPPAWSAYAAQVGQHLQDELGNPQDPAAARLHKYLDARAAADPSAAPPSPVISLWFGRNGRIGRVEFTSLGDPQADQDLRAVLTSHPVGASAPRDMRQPLVIRLRLTYSS